MGYLIRSGNDGFGNSLNVGRIALIHATQPSGLINEGGTGLWFVERNSFQEAF